MRFVFDERKATDAAAYLLTRQNGSMKYVKLLKLMYLADRQSFVETGYPITGAKMVSMDKGPILSEVYSQIAWGEDSETFWSKCITAPSDFGVSLRFAVDEFLHLSDYEEELLGGVFDQYGHLEPWALARFTHTLPEWRDPDGSSLPIDTRVILEEAGKSNDEIQAVAALVAGIHAMRNNGISR